MTFAPRILRGGRPCKVLVEHDAHEPISRVALVQLLLGGQLIVSGRQKDLAVQMDWLARVAQALELEGTR